MGEWEDGDGVGEQEDGVGEWEDGVGERDGGDKRPLREPINPRVLCRPTSSNYIPNCDYVNNIDNIIVYFSCILLSTCVHLS